MERICKHCGCLIALLGLSWSHVKTGNRACDPPLFAEPVDVIEASPSHDSSYVAGLHDGRKAARTQDKRSRNWSPGPITIKAREILTEAFHTRLADVKRVESLCESPIEQLFALAVIIQADAQFNENDQAWIDREGITMEAQKLIRDYRADFVFCNRLVVEIDGHDFHDRDQSQASRDRKRDRDLLRAGMVVIRFTGSDVYSAPLDCATETRGFVIKMRGQNNGYISTSRG